MANTQNKMKKVMTISGLIIATSFILSGYVGNNQDLKEKTTKDSLEVGSLSKRQTNVANKATKMLQVKMEAMAKQVTIDSLNKINAINKIIGDYTSNEGSYILDSRGTEYDKNGKEIIEAPKEEIKWEHLTIEKKGSKIIITQNYSKPSVSEICNSAYIIFANAEVLDIKETENDIFNLSLKKIACKNYCGCPFFGEDGNSELNVSESNYKLNSEFGLIINMKNNNKIEIKSEIKSEISETECSSWDFNGLTFIKK